MNALAPALPEIALENAPEARRALLVGMVDAHLRSLIVDVMHDMRVDVLLADSLGNKGPDVVLAMVESQSDLANLKLLRRSFGRTPVVAVLPMAQQRLGTRAVAAGAQACYVLGMPLAQLRGVVSALLREATPKHRAA